MSFLTYLWLRYDGTPYYVGKGCRKARAFTSDAHTVSRPVDSERIVVQEWASESDAFEAERFLIAFYGRLDNGTGILRNRTDGGDGAAGCIPTEAARRNMSRSAKGHRKTSEHRQKIGVAHLGMKRSEETCRHISESNKGKGHPHTAESRLKIRLANIRNDNARFLHAK